MNSCPIKWAISFLVLTSFCHAGSAEETAFKTNATENEAFQKGTFSHQNLEKAWQHQAFAYETAAKHPDLFPTILAYGEVATANNMGLSSGYAPAVTIAVEDIVDDSKPMRLLEIGSGYGFDAMSLIKRHPQLQITTIELDPTHVEKMKVLMGRALNEAEQTRLEPLQGDFLHPDGSLADKQYDVAVVSKVLHFYDEGDIHLFLTNLYPLLKPGAKVVMSHISNRVAKVIEVASSFYGGYMTQPKSLWDLLPTSQNVGKLYYFSPEDMSRLAKDAGYNVIANEYVGTVQEKKSTSSGWLGGPNTAECILHTVLEKPERP